MAFVHVLSDGKEKLVVFQIVLIVLNAAEMEIALLLIVVLVILDMEVLHVTLSFVLKDV